MRPTDENQHGSTRPNLMSPPPPGGGDENILAMLDRDAGRGRSSGLSSHPRMAWYAGAGALVVAMVGALGWLAWENATRERELPLTVVQAVPPSELTVAAAPPAFDAPTPSVDRGGQSQLAALVAAPVAPQTAPPAASVQPEPPVPQTAGAAIIDSPAAPAEEPVLLAQATSAVPVAPAAAAPAPVPVPARAAQPSGVPPLVLLPPEEARPKRAAPLASTEQARPTPARAARTKVATTSRPAAKAAAAPARASARANAARPAPSRAAAKAPPRRPARPALARSGKGAPAKQAAQPKQSQDAAPDNDVALISAIIMHSSKHAAERAKAEAAKSCEGAKCRTGAAAKE